MALLAELAQAIERETARFTPGDLRRATEELSCRYRGEESRGSQLVVSPVQRAAYLVTRLPATFAAITAVLREAGMSMDDLVQVQIYCSDVSLFERFNKVYGGYFKRELPARAFLGSGPLLFGARFEMMGIAVKR